MAFGDSITDGTASTMNGDDRWPDVLSRRLHAIHGNRVAVVNAGIGGNQVAGPAEYGPQKPFPGGPSAEAADRARRARAVGRQAPMIWLEGINDFSKNGNATLETVQDGMKEVVGADPRAGARHPRDRRHGGDRARLLERRARLSRAGREAQGAERVHPHVGPVRRRRRFRQGDARSADRRPQAASSCPTARPAGRATSCIRTAPAIWRWAWRSISSCSSRKQAGQ